jgi:hypothetical protein
MTDLMFRSFPIPCLGFAFVPWARLMHALVNPNGPGASVLDGRRLVLTLRVKIAMLGTTAAAKLDRLPAAVPGSTRPAAAWGPVASRCSLRCGRGSTHAG